MRIHNIKKYDQINSMCHGASVTVWVNQCPHRCKGCFNSYTWDRDDSLEIPNREVADKILLGLNGNMKLSSLCWLGGEPLAIWNYKDVLEVTQMVKKERPDIFVYSYSGYTWEQIRKMEFLKELINELEVIIDGRFVQELVVEKEPFGSSNQRVINVRESLKKNNIVLYNYKGGLND